MAGRLKGNTGKCAGRWRVTGRGRLEMDLWDFFPWPAYSEWLYKKSACIFCHAVTIHKVVDTRAVGVLLYRPLNKHGAYHMTGQSEITAMSWTNIVEKNPSLRWSRQSPHLMEPGSYYRVHKRPTLVPILSHTVYTFLPVLMSVLILSFRLSRSSPFGFFTSGKLRTWPSVLVVLFLLRNYRRSPCWYGC
jgi:hypothetical protein